MDGWGPAPLTAGSGVPLIFVFPSLFLLLLLFLLLAGLLFAVIKEGVCLPSPPCLPTKPWFDMGNSPKRHLP
jgi:hypothetical protein